LRRINNAAVRRKERFRQLDEIRGRVEELTREPIEKNFYSEDVKRELKRVDLEIKKDEEEEKLLSIKQRNQGAEVGEVKRKIDELTNRIESVGHLASITSQEQFRRLEEMQKAFLEMHPAKVAEQEQVRKFTIERVKPIEEKKAELAREKAAEIKRPKIHPKIIKSIEKQISDAEKLHKRLQKAGHPPERLEILKDKIDMHKRKLKEIKASNPAK